MAFLAHCQQEEEAGGVYVGGGRGHGTRDQVTSCDGGLPALLVIQLQGLHRQQS